MTELRRLLVIMKPALPVIVLAALLSFLTVGANVGLLATSAYLIAYAALHPPLAALAVAITGVRFFGISRAIFRYGERYISHHATFQILYRLRVWFYERLEPLAPAGLARFGSGDLLGRIVADVDTLQFFYLRVIAPPVVAMAILAVMWWFLIDFSTALAWLLTAAFAAGGVAAPYSLRRLGRRNGAELLAVRSELKARLVDMIQGMTELAAYNQAERQAERLAATGSRLSLLQNRSANLAALSESVSSLAMNAAIWGTLVIAIPLAAAGQIEKIHLAVLTLAVQASFEAVQPLPLTLYVLEESMAAACRLFAVADAEPVVAETGNASVVPKGLDIVFDQVSFAYGPNRPVLSKLSFTLPAGKRLAVVGASGAGKTTIASLLLRFWDLQAGTIRLGGRSLVDYHPDVLRQCFAVVSQHTHIFNASMGDNIRLARPDATDAELWAAIEQTALADFITGLPQGLDTQAGLNGKALSGGQRQRVSIARALLKDAPILILDEPTVGLDAVTEQQVMAAVQQLMAGRTTLLITHRLTGLEGMDEILVLHQGSIVEQGTAAELIARKGYFYQMWQLQRDVLPAALQSE